MLDNSGNSPFNLAILLNRENFIKKFFESEVNFNIHNKRGDTPMHTAIVKNLEIMISKLIKKNADSTIENRYPSSCIRVAAIVGNEKII